VTYSPKTANTLQSDFRQGELVLFDGVGRRTDSEHLAQLDLTSRSPEAHDPLDGKTLGPEASDTFSLP